MRCPDRHAFQLRIPARLAIALTIACQAAFAGTSFAQSASVYPAVNLTGEIRERVQFISGIMFESDEDTTAWTQRLAASADIRFDKSLSVHASLLSAIQSGADKSPVDTNTFDFHEGYLEVGAGPVAWRAGRQELEFGSQRLVGTRDGTNVRRAWDGVHMTVKQSGRQADVFWMRPVSVEPRGTFNDTANEGRVLAGAYLNTPGPIGSLDLYYLYASINDRMSVEGRGDERRHSLGLRSFGEKGRVYWNWEGVYQFGEQGDATIQAWTVASITGMRFPHLPMAPELSLSANVASGDSANGDRKLETFDALYPRGNYFSNLAQLGPSNFFNLDPQFTLHPSDRLTLTGGVNFFWRLERADGVYSPSGDLIFPPGGQKQRYINTALSLGGTWQISERLSFETEFTIADPGSFIEEQAYGATANFLELTLLRKF